MLDNAHDCHAEYVVMYENYHGHFINSDRIKLISIYFGPKKKKAGKND